MASSSKTGAIPSFVSGFSEPTATFQRQPPGTLSLLFLKIPVEQVPRVWRNIPLELHLDVELRPKSDGTVEVFAPMRAGLVARVFGSKLRKMGVLPDFAAATIQIKHREGARIRARLVEVPPPKLRGQGTDMGCFLSVRCKS